MPTRKSHGTEAPSSENVRYEDPHYLRDFLLFMKSCRYRYSDIIFTLATLCVERVLATATCPSVTAGVETERASVMISSPSDSPMTSLSGEV